MQSTKYAVGKARDIEPTIEQPPDAGVVPSLFYRWILSGPSKSGKTNLARWSLDKYYMKSPNKSWFDRVILMSPTAQIDWNWANLPGLSPKDRITDPSPSHLTKLLRDQIKSITGGMNVKNPNLRTLADRKRRAKKVLIIFDDAVAESKLIRSPAFLKLFIQGRHYNISSMVMTQSYMLVPRSVRLQATHIAMFPSRSSEIDRLYTEHGPRQLSKTDFTEMVQYATQPDEVDKFPFLYVDCFAPITDRFRRNFTHTLRLKPTKEATLKRKTTLFPFLLTNHFSVSPR